MKCSKCGAELSEDTKFCSYCGNKVEMPPKQENVSEEDIPSIPYDGQMHGFQNQKEPPKSLADKMKEKASAEFFAVCICTCEENEGLQREHPFGAGFPIGARAALLAHDFACKV